MTAPDPRVPALQVTRWFNCERPPDLASLRGRVVMIEAFQMLCPGCVSHALPQATRVFEMFDPADVAVIGLHTVFEHHAAMGPDALAAFLHEYRIRFPVAVDEPASGGDAPRTMQSWGLRGTPSVVLLDREGCRRLQHFGRISDLELGAQLMALCRESAPPAPVTTEPGHEGLCDGAGCALPGRPEPGGPG